MKSYNHLFEKIIETENLRLAIHRAAKKKHKRKYVQKVLQNEDYHIKRMQDILINDKFTVRKHTPKIIDDGFAHKKRKIVQPDFMYEQIIHHAVMQILIPIFSKGMYKYNCASIPKRGNSYGKKYIERAIRKDKENTKYVLKADIKHFFQNINHDILKAALKKIIHDNKCLNILFTIIDSYDDGLPLGYFTSQWFANFYLQVLDYFIKQKMRIKYYTRFMDDLVLFCRSKEQLHYVRMAMQMFISKHLKLTLKQNWQVFPLAENKKKPGRCLDFMGYKFYKVKTILRKNIMLKGTRKISKIKKKGKYTWYDATQLVSNYGWIKNTNSWKLFIKFFTDNKIFISDLKRKISCHQIYINSLKVVVT